MKCPECLGSRSEITWPNDEYGPCPVCVIDSGETFVAMDVLPGAYFEMLMNDY